MTYFTYKYYTDLLDFIKNSGIKIVNFSTIPEPSVPYVILRHDIDFSLQKALEMARLEQGIGVKSTFFILLTAPYYNPLSEEGVTYIKEIAAMGHEIGLHYDCTGFELLSDAQIQNRVQVLAGALSDSAGVPVHTIAQHKPAKSPVRKDFPAFRNAYSPQYFSDIPYISDSRKMFRHPDLFDFFRKSKRSQLLIHPVWWNEEDKSVTAIFDALFAGVSLDMKQKLMLEQEGIESWIARLPTAR